jgi:hypothetical protein
LLVIFDDGNGYRHDGIVMATSAVRQMLSELQIETSFRIQRGG